MHKPMETQQMDTTGWFKRLLDARTQSKLTQRELAEQLGVPQGHISRIERGLIDPRVSTVTQMAYALGLKPMLLCFDLSLKSLLIECLSCVTEMLGSGTDGANLNNDLGPSCYARVGYRMTFLRHGTASV